MDGLYAKVMGSFSLLDSGLLAERRKGEDSVISLYNEMGNDPLLRIRGWQDGTWRDIGRFDINQKAILR